MHIMFLDFLRDPFDLCPTSSSFEGQLIGISVQVDDHVERRPIMILTSSTSR